MGFNGIYPLVNCPITMERSTMLSMGKSTISMVMFNSYVTNYQRVVNVTLYSQSSVLISLKRLAFVDSAPAT